MSSILRLLALSLAVVVSVNCMAAAPFESPAVDFANRIKDASGAGTLTLTYTNAAGLDPEMLKVISTAIETQLRSAGVKLAPGGKDVRVTFSANERGWVWMAEIGSDLDRKVLVMEVPEAESVVAGKNLSLRRELLFHSTRPILDVLRVPATSGTILVALTPDSLLVYGQMAAQWTLQQQVRIERDLPMPRDARGHLVAATDHFFDIYLPGQVCASGAAVPVTLTCRNGDDLWPLGTQNAFFSAGRNFFSGLMRPGFAKQVAPFYSAAQVSSPDKATWTFAGVDGKVTFTEGAAQLPLPGAEQWGSDIAPLAACAAGVIASSRSSDPSHDSLQFFQVVNRQATASTAALEFHGPIFSLWSHDKDSTAIVVIRNANGQRYEAYSIDLSCN